MSKIIESLKAGVREQSGRSAQELTQEQLAEIYFSGADKTRRSDQPLVIKVIEKERVSPVMPWFIASIALLVTAFALFSTKRIFIDVRVMDDANLATSDWSGPSKSAKDAAPRSEGQPLSIENVVFEGAAKVRSGQSGRELSLVNSSVAPFAKASLFLNAPLDLSRSKIVFYAKGERGGENLAVAIKDADNRLGFDKGKYFPFPAKLSTEWQRAEITLTETPAGFDPQRVMSLRFEFGTKDADNRSGDIIKVRDIEAVTI